ncbi:MAG: hypothetical protein GXY41_01535 [Phycisphaerae bacterium]|nr:hypothetical protein [Phycisphaerae bacterium]
MKTNAPYNTFKTDLNRFLIAIVDWQKQGQDAADKADVDTANRYDEDVKDLTDIFNALQSGHYRAACELVWQLDTIVKDQIPKRLYNYIATAAGCR